MGELEHVTTLIIRVSHNSLKWLVNCFSKSKLQNGFTTIIKVFLLHHVLWVNSKMLKIMA